MSWRIGVSTGCCLEEPILRVLDAAAAADVRAVEIGTPPRHFNPWARDQVEAVAARLAATGVQPVSIHAPFGGLLDLAELNPHHRAAAVGAILTAAAVLKELGGTIVVVHATDVPRDHQDVGHRLALCAASLRELDAACRHMDLTLAIESPLPHLIGGHPDEFRWILDQVGPEPRVCLDTGHTTLGGQWDRFVEVAGARLLHVHANDHRGQRDDHLPPGEGNLDWRHIGASLQRAGYAGWIMLELRCPTAPLAEHFRRARERLAELLG